MKKVLPILAVMLMFFSSCGILKKTSEYHMVKYDQSQIDALKATGELTAGTLGEFVGSAPVWAGTDTYHVWVATPSYANGGSYRTTSYTHPTGFYGHAWFDTADPANNMQGSVYVRISSTADSDRTVGLGIVNLTELQGAWGDRLTSSDLTSTTAWYQIDYSMGPYSQETYYEMLDYLIDLNGTWDWSDDYGILVAFEDCGTYGYADNVEFGYPSTKATVSGPSSAYVTSANLPAYTATFTATSGKNAYQWEVYSGPNAHIVGSSTGQSCVVDFDAYGGYQIAVKVKNTASSIWTTKTLKSHTVYPSY